MRAGVDDWFKRKSWFPGCCISTGCPWKGPHSPVARESDAWVPLPGSAGSGWRSLPARVGKWTTWTTRGDVQQDTCPRWPPMLQGLAEYERCLAWVLMRWELGRATAHHLNDKGLAQGLWRPLPEHTYTLLCLKTSLLTGAPACTRCWRAPEHCLMAAVLSLLIWEVGMANTVSWGRSAWNFCLLSPSLSGCGFPLTHPTSLHSLSLWVLVTPWSHDLGLAN